MVADHGIAIGQTPDLVILPVPERGQQAAGWAAWVLPYPVREQYQRVIYSL